MTDETFVCREPRKRWKFHFLNQIMDKKELANGCSCTNADSDQIDLLQVFITKCTTWNQTLGNLSLRQHNVRQDNITWRVRASLSTLETTSQRQNDQRRLWQKWSPHFCMRAHVRSSIMYCHRCYASVWWWLSHPVTHRSCGKTALWDTRHLNLCPSNNEHKLRRLWDLERVFSLWYTWSP